MTNSKTRLSLAMIVRDEEDCIKTCLDSVAGLVDEIIVVDTGSADKTPEICRSYGAHIFFYNWNNNFAEARNFGLDKVTLDWVLWLDADEEVAPTNREQLHEQLCLANCDAFSLPLVNFYGERSDRDQIIMIAQPRLFRNHMGFRFENRIHEWLNLSSAYERDRVGFINLEIYHYGYINSMVEGKQKFNRNVNLLLQELAEEKSHAWTHYYLAAEYYRRQDYKRAFEQVNQSIKLFINDGQIPPPSMLYSLKYSILIQTGSWEGAWPGIKSAVKMFPHYVDLRFYMGVILFHKKMFPEALACFTECLRLGEDNLNYLTLRGLGSFQAWFYRGLCLEALNKPEKAFMAYLEALATSEAFSPAREAIIKLINEGPDRCAGLIQDLEPGFKSLLTRIYP